MVSGFQEIVSNFPVLLGLKPFTHDQTVEFEIGIVMFLIISSIVEISRQKYPSLYQLLIAIGFMVFIIATFWSLAIATDGYVVILLILFFPLIALFI